MRRAGTAVLATAVLLASCSSPPPRDVSPPPEVVAPAPAVVLSKGITFAAVGDIMMGTDYPENVLPDDDGVGFLSGVAPVLSAADITFGNLEGVLMDGGEAVKRCKPPASTKRKTEPPKQAARSPETVPPPAPTAAESPTPGDIQRGATSPATPPSADTPRSPVPANGEGLTEEAGAASPPQVESTSPPAASSTEAAPTEAASPTQGDTQRGATSPAAPTSADTPRGPVATNEDASKPAEPASPSQQPTTTSGQQPAADASTSTPSSAPAAPAAPSTTSVQPAPPAVEQPVTAGSCYVFRSPTRYANYLRDAGFDVISLANNHAQDFGDPGRDSSMRTLDAVGIHHSGREGDIAEWTTQGRRFALVAFAPNVGSHQLNDLVRAQELVKTLAANHDIVIVSFHGGSEGEGASTLPFAHEMYAGEDRGDVVEFAHTVIDAGADLVIGHGPHVLRAVELYRARLIAYSLGNFATYYGISVNGIRGLSGILTTRLADDGRFLEARLDPTIQIRPAGPTLDPERRAVTQLRELTTQAFPTGSLRIEDDGRILLTQP